MRLHKWGTQSNVKFMYMGHPPTDSVRFLTPSLSTQKMFEVIPPNHAVEMSELFGT
jgi:hypothetical protein